MRRFFIDKKLIIGETITVSGDEARHMLTVLRMHVGDKLILINGSGIEVTASITDTASDSVLLELIGDMPCAAEPANKVTLYQCLPKAGKMEMIIQKCVELGITRICPVISKRCVVKPDNFDSKLKRYNKVSAEAAKQSGRGIVPEVSGITDLRNTDLSEYDLVLAAYENEDTTTLKQALRNYAKCDDPMNIAIVIGPEGGFEQNEIDLLLASNPNAHSVSLGKRILRTETAGIAMLAMLLYELEG